MLNCLHQVLRIDLRFGFYCSGSKMLKNRSKQNSYHACNFIHNYREKRFCLEHLIQCDVEPAHQDKSRSQ